MKTLLQDSRQVEKNETESVEIITSEKKNARYFSRKHSLLQSERGGGWSLFTFMNECSVECAMILFACRYLIFSPQL